MERSAEGVQSSVDWKEFTDASGKQVWKNEATGEVSETPPAGKQLDQTELVVEDASKAAKKEVKEETVQLTKEQKEQSPSTASKPKTPMKPDFIERHALSTVLEGESLRSPSRSPGKHRDRTGKTSSNLRPRESSGSRSTKLEGDSSVGMVEVLQKVEGSYRMFAPVRASAIPTFTRFGDVTEESGAILELIRNSLAINNQSMHDLVRVDVRLVDFRQLQFFDEVYEKYFQGTPAPQRNVVSVGPMTGGCTIEVEVTSLIRDSSGQSSQSNKGLEMGSLDKSSEMTSLNRPPVDNAKGSVFSFFGDILPPRLAQAYGYYGETTERVFSGILVLTIVRYILLLFAIVNITLIQTSGYEAIFSGTTNPIRGPAWFLAVASLILIHSVIICLYSFVWWYQGENPDKQVEAWFYSILIVFQLGGDFIFTFLSFSAFTSIATLTPFLPDQSKQRARFLSATVMSFLTFIVFLFTAVLSRHLKISYSKLGNNFQALKNARNPVKGITTPTSQGSSAYNVVSIGQNRLVTPSSYNNAGLYTPQTLNSTSQVVNQRVLTPGSQGSNQINPNMMQNNPNLIQSSRLVQRNSFNVLSHHSSSSHHNVPHGASLGHNPNMSQHGVGHNSNHNVRMYDGSNANQVYMIQQSPQERGYPSNLYYNNRSDI